MKELDYHFAVTNNLKTALHCCNLCETYPRFFAVLSIVVDVESEEGKIRRTNVIRIPAIPWRGSSEVSILGANLQEGERRRAPLESNLRRAPFPHPSRDFHGLRTLRYADATLDTASTVACPQAHSGYRLTSIHSLLACSFRDSVLKLPTKTIRRWPSPSPLTVAAMR